MQTSKQLLAARNQSYTESQHKHLTWTSAWRSVTLDSLSLACETGRFSVAETREFSQLPAQENKTPATPSSGRNAYISEEL